MGKEANNANSAACLLLCLVGRRQAHRLHLNKILTVVVFVAMLP